MITVGTHINKHNAFKLNNYMEILDTYLQLYKKVERKVMKQFDSFK